MSTEPGLKIQKSVPLGRYSTFGIGGPAHYFVEVRTLEDMRQALRYSQEHDLPPLVIGKGSNCLFDDRGYAGLAIFNRIDYLDADSTGFFTVGSGYSFARLGGVTARRGWSGLEFASGIPGSVGGAVYMNAGAGGAETCDVVEEVTFIYSNGQDTVFERSELAFSYRSSQFHKLQGAIVEVKFRLQPSLHAKKTQTDLLQYRQSTQPYGEKSAGCIFRNSEKGAAGLLIERSNLKGRIYGDAQVSFQHGNFIINRGAASASDVKALIAQVREEVQKKTGVVLQTEVRFIPYTPSREFCGNG